MAVACGFSHTLAVSEDGAIWTWGKGEFGALGNGSVDHRRCPVRIVMEGGASAVVVAAGDRHSAAVTEDGW